MATTPTATNEMRVIIAGPRAYADYPYLRTVCLGILQPAIERGIEITIVSGKAPGTDEMGERFADEFQLDKVGFYANWTKHGNSAGPKRNRKMGRFATHAIVFWDGKIKRSGSLDMIHVAEELRLTLRIPLIESAARQRGKIICSSLAETNLV